MLSKLGNDVFWQYTGRPIRAGEFPFPEHPATRTTWRQWQSLHSDTDLYDGDDASP